MPQLAAIYVQNPTRELIERDFRLSVCPTSVAGAAGRRTAVVRGAAIHHRAITTSLRPARAGLRAT
ncbi:MAG: hypothetical protein ACXU87_08270, partial [Xanthobacteraceae bacterium]